MNHMGLLEITHSNFMKISLPIQQDTDNSFPTGELEFFIGEKYITIKIDDSDREISVSKEDFLKISKLI